MMNYKVIQSAVVDRFDVFETQTEQVVLPATTNKIAKEMCRNLNLGAGFDGRTPSFFLQQIHCPVQK
jgi:hypothetical protein